MSDHVGITGPQRNRTWGLYRRWQSLRSSMILPPWWYEMQTKLACQEPLSTDNKFATISIWKVTNKNINTCAVSNLVWFNAGHRSWKVKVDLIFLSIGWLLKLGHGSLFHFWRLFHFQFLGFVTRLGFLCLEFGTQSYTTGLTSMQKNTSEKTKLKTFSVRIIQLCRAL